MRIAQTRSVLALAIAATVAAASAHAKPQAFIGLSGSWTGNGQIVLENGDKEALKCKAYYTDKGEDLGIALRCASTSYKIDLRAQLAAAGTAITGNWEERQFNASGNATGEANGNKITNNSIRGVPGVGEQGIFIGGSVIAGTFTPEVDRNRATSNYIVGFDTPVEVNGATNTVLNANGNDS